MVCVVVAIGPASCAVYCQPVETGAKLVILLRFSTTIAYLDSFDNMTSLTKTNNAGDVHPALRHAATLASGPAYKGVPPPTGDVAKLNANEMSYGPHPEIIKAAEEASRLFHVYTDPGQNDLREAIASTHDGFTKDEVVAGAGSDDMLDVLLRVIKPKRAILTPTFGMYKALCTLHDIPMVNIPRTNDGTFRQSERRSQAIRRNLDHISGQSK